jgi:hypothetical protein
LHLADGYADLGGGPDMREVGGGRRVHRDERGQPDENERFQVQVGPLERHRVDVGQCLEHRRFSLGHRLGSSQIGRDFQV